MSNPIHLLAPVYYPNPQYPDLGLDLAPALDLSQYLNLSTTHFFLFHILSPPNS